MSEVNTATERLERKPAYDASDRDASLKLIDWFDKDRVKSARVLVVGAGAIGNEVLKNLALLGIGHIHIFDRDTVEMANLSRSVLYRASDDGKLKAETAARAVQSINPTVCAFWQLGDIQFDLGEGLIRQMDVVIGCLDSMDARYLLNRLCWRAGRPWIDAGIGQLSGNVTVFNPLDGPCYECSFTDEHYRHLQVRRPCNVLASINLRQGRIPTTPMIASLVAAVQVQECLKLLDPERWEGRTLGGRQFIFNGTVCEADISRVPSRQDCPAHQVIADEEIVKLTDMSASAEAGSLLVRAEQLLGGDAHLYLENEIAIERTCPSCHESLLLLRPVSRVFREELTCQRCNREFKWDSDITMTHIVATRSRPELLASRLYDLGVPLFGLVEARGPGGTTVYFELAADADVSKRVEG